MISIENAAVHHPGKGSGLSILHDTLLNIGTKFGQLLPGQPCVLCGRMSRDGLWCAACDASLPYMNMPRCPACARPTPNSETCGHCLRHPPSFARTTAAFAYAFPFDKLVQAMKYGEQLALAHAFAHKLAQRIDRGNLPDCVIPMPLHPAKLRERGYNQSQLLAAPICRRFGLDLLPHACERVRDTAPQSSLPWKERKKNMRNAFSCEMDLSGRRIALVDDVLTTGASLSALAEAVRRCGAAEVETWVVARTLPHSGLRRKD